MKRPRPNAALRALLGGEEGAMPLRFGHGQRNSEAWSATINHDAWRFVVEPEKAGSWLVRLFGTAPDLVACERRVQVVERTGYRSLEVALHAAQLIGMAVLLSDTTAPRRFDWMVERAVERRSGNVVPWPVTSRRRTAA